jgi:histidine triad (HIT) family protein
MDQDCLFCQIVDGQIPGRTVYEDETTLAFLDVNPLAAGHTLVIPKPHHEYVQDMPADLAGDVFQTVSAVTPAVEAAVDAPATTIAVNNGEVAGQEIPHVHVHVVPRFEDDAVGPIHAFFGGQQEMADDELDAIEADIAAHL